MREQAPRRTKTLFSLGLVSLALLAAIAALGAQAEAVAATTTYASDLGYSIELPSGWRTSSLLSARIAQPREVIGHDVFTVQSSAQEARTATEVLGAAWQYALVVEAWANPSGATPMDWALSADRSGWAKGQRIAQTSIGRQTGAVITGGARYTVAYLVARGDRMFVLGYRTDLGPIPAGASANALRSMIDSFRLQ